VVAGVPPGRLCAVAVHDGEKLVALAPVYLEEGALGRRLLPIGIGVTDYLDVLVDPAFPRPVRPWPARSTTSCRIGSSGNSRN
jgi:hypothetical protein